jgi:hypothetical protein
VLGEFLRHCDLAKFARWILSAPQMEDMLQSASAFIVATGKPIAEQDTLPAHLVRASVSSPPPLEARLGAPVSIHSTVPAASRTASPNFNPHSL